MATRTLATEVKFPHRLEIAGENETDLRNNSFPKLNIKVQLLLKFIEHLLDGRTLNILSNCNSNTEE